MTTAVAINGAIVMTDASNAPTNNLAIATYGAGGAFQLSGSVLLSGAAAGSITRKIRAASDNATPMVFQASTYESTILVEDIGPSGNPA
jgi:hypothetical protein